MKTPTKRATRRLAASIAIATALAASSAWATDRTINANYALTGYETVDGVLTVESGVTVDLKGYHLTVQGLAGDGTITSSANYSSDLTSPDTTGTHVTWSTKAGDATGANGGSGANLFNDSELVAETNDNDKRILVGKAYLPLAVTYDFGEGEQKKVGKYRLYMTRNNTKNKYYTRGPKAWTFEGSNDNATWTSLDSKSGITWAAYNASSNPYKEYAIGNEASYRYYRITFTSSNDGSYLELNRLEYFSSPELHVAVAAGESVTNSTVAIAGSVKVVKGGEGEFAEAKAGQAYTGGTVLTEGTYALAGTASLDWPKFTLGTDPAKPVTLRVGENATLSNISASMIVGSNITATVYKEGGNWSVPESLFFNYVGSSTNVFNHNGGELTVAGKLAIPRMGSGEFNMNGGTVTVVGSEGTVFGSSSVGDHALLNLEGGEFATPFLKYHNGASGKIATVRFNGGTLKITESGAMAQGDNNVRGTDYSDVANLQDVLLFKVAAGGGTIDTATHDVTMPLAILEDSESIGGGMTFKGGGSITLGAVPTYTGGTVVEAGTTLSVTNGITFAGPVAFAAGSTLNIAYYTVGVVPFSASALTLPAEGTVGLTLNGGAFPVGAYAICSATGVTAADGAKFAPSTGGETASWKVVGGTLVLTVGTVADNYWTGLAGDGKMSTPDNWAGGTAPADGEDVDFSSVTVTTRINADIANVTFGAVTMGSGAVVFANDNMTAKSFSDMEKVAVAENSTVTLDGDLVFGTNVESYVCRYVFEGGKFVVTGDITAAPEQTGNLYPYNNAPGWISAKGLVNNAAGDKFYLVQADNGNWQANWLIGEDGISGAYRYNVGASGKGKATIKATADFAVSSVIIQRNNLVLVPDGHVITLGTSVAANAGGIIGGVDNGLTTVTGPGKVVVNYNVTNLTSYANSRKNAFTVADGGMLAIVPGANPSVSTDNNGTLTVNDGATLEVAESGTVTLGSNLTLADGAALAFNFTENKVAPVLDVTGKTVTAAGTVNVKIAAASGIRPVTAGGKFTLTSGGKFAGVTVSLDETNKPDWALGVSVENGNVVLDVRPLGTIFLIK